MLLLAPCLMKVLFYELVLDGSIERWQREIGKKGVVSNELG
jgi:hypothetical protein